MKSIVVYKSKNKLTDYSAALSAGLQLRADIDEDTVLEPWLEQILKQRCS